MVDKSDSCGALILAAGLSRRMGDTHKLLAPLGDKAVIAHVLSHILAAGFTQPLVVLGAQATEMRAVLADYDVQLIDAPDYHLGMAHSLAAGLRAAPHHWEAALICLGDMISVQPDTYRHLRDFPADSQQVVVPHHQGQRGNPVRWGRAYFTKLMALRGDVGGRALLEDAQVIAWPCADPGILQDIDTPAALARARAAYASSAQGGPRNT